MKTATETFIIVIIVGYITPYEYCDGYGYASDWDIHTYVFWAFVLESFPMERYQYALLALVPLVHSMETHPDVAVFVLTKENATRHVDIRAQLVPAGLVDVRFIPAIYHGDTHECMEVHDVDMIGCDVHRERLAKRIGMFCSWIHRLLPALVDHGEPALVLEDDFKVRPSVDRGPLFGSASQARGRAAQTGASEHAA
jgi:hypothetical protein